MKVSSFITPYCKAVLESWAAEYHTTKDNIVNVLLEYAYTNNCINPPIKVSDATNAQNETVHVYFEIWNEDYITTTQNFGKKSIKLSRILEYLITYETFDKSYFDMIDMSYNKVNIKSTNKMSFNKFLIEEQTKLAMIPDSNIKIVKNALYDNFDIVWPILKFANSRLHLQSEFVDYIEKILTIRGKKDET